jgi:D-amino-acid dehydrogenase
MSDPGQSVLVVGGGIIGATCAYYLAESGKKVTVIDQATFGSQCSLHNCGYVCPSHVLPLTEPGAVWATLKGMFKPNSPFSVKFRPDWRLADWFLRFTLRCNEKDMMKGARGLYPLLQSSMNLYRELLAKERIDCEWQDKGLFYVYKDKNKFSSFAATNDMLTEKFGETAVRVEGKDLREFEPALKEGLAGGWHYTQDAHLRSDLLMSELKKNLLKKGVKILENRALTGLRESGEGLVAETDDGEIETKRLVLATGALTPKLAKIVGWRAPIEPGKGYSITMKRPSICPDVPLIFPETRVAVTPFADGYRLGSTMEFSGYDNSIHPKRLNLLRNGVEEYLKEPYGEPVTNTWYGWRPMTYDSLPIIGPCPGNPKVTLATGHNMLGLSLAPATGKLVAELLTGKATHIETKPYSPERF